MVTNQVFKNYSNQIAELFCSDSENKVLCMASVSNRLNTFLDDSIYPVFLSKLSEGGRFYITNLENFQNKGFRIVIVDLISGERQTAWWTIEYNYPYLSKLPAKLQSHKYYIISKNKTFNESDKSEIRITYNPEKPGYNIAFVPSQIPPGGGGSPPINLPPGNFPPGNIIPKSQVPTDQKEDLIPEFDLDFKTIALIGLGGFLIYKFVIK